MIELRNVTKSYLRRTGVNRVLDNVSVLFPTGRSIGILGLNGAGKSTLLRLLSGAEPPDSGTVHCDVKVSWPIGFQGGFQGSLTGRQNARFIARIYGARGSDVEGFAKEFSELGEYFDMPVSKYSSGMRARLAFAVSMAVDFDCYLVDEATAVGDARFKAKYSEAFQERRDRSTMIMVSHSEQTIRRDCDMAGVLHRGKITLYPTVDEAIDAYRICIQAGTSH